VDELIYNLWAWWRAMRPVPLAKVNGWSFKPVHFKNGKDWLNDSKSVSVNNGPFPLRFLHPGQLSASVVC